MKYRIMLTDAAGAPRTLVGFKDVSGQTFGSVWPETTRLNSGPTAKAVSLLPAVLTTSSSSSST